MIFTDEQTLVGPYLESSDEEEEIEDIEEEDEEEIPSTKASTEVLDNSQPESVCIQNEQVYNKISFCILRIFLHKTLLL